MSCIFMGIDGGVLFFDLEVMAGVYYLLQGVVVDLIVILEGFFWEMFDEYVYQFQQWAWYVVEVGYFLKLLVFIYD